MNNDYHVGRWHSEPPKPVIKLRIVKPNGQSEVIEVTEYKEYDPQDVVPVKVNLTPIGAKENWVYKGTFISILRTMLQNEVPIAGVALYVKDILFCPYTSASDLVHAL